MGIDQSIVPEDILFTKISHFQKYKSKPLYDIYYNIDDPHQHIEIYQYIFKKTSADETVDLDQQDLSFYAVDFDTNIKIYKKRRRIKQNIVGIRGIVEIQEQPVGFCDSNLLLSVAVERYLYRLTDIRYMTEYDFIVFLYNIVKGYKQLSNRINQRYRLFWIDQTMIYINKQGRTKIWYNQNLALNYPSEILNENRLPNQNLQNKIIRQIIRIVTQSMSISKYNANLQQNSQQLRILLEILPLKQTIAQCITHIRAQYEKNAYIQFDNAFINVSQINTNFVQEFVEFPRKRINSHQNPYQLSRNRQIRSRGCLSKCLSIKNKDKN